MSDEKGIVSKEETFDKLEIRLGRVIGVEEEPTAPKKGHGSNEGNTFGWP